MSDYNKFPDIEIYNQFFNPTITSPNSPYEISFYQTKETLLDIETYKKFLDSAVSRFRKSKRYKHYKGYLMGLGLDHCQFNGNITAEMASIEMHHCILTIYDVAIIITEHVLNTKGYISTFDLVQLLKQEHGKNMIALVMLSLTAHQLEHNTEEFYISPSMCFGNWYKFLEKYNTGISQDIAFKILFYIKRAIENEGKSIDSNLLDLREKIINWSSLNNQVRNI